MLEQKVCIKLQKILQKCICSSKTAVYMLHQKCRFLPNMPVSRFDSSCDSLENYHMATAVCIEETLMVWHVSLWFFPPLSCCTLLEFEKHYNSLCLAIILPSSVSCSLATCEMCFSSFLHKEVKFAYHSKKNHLSMMPLPSVLSSSSGPNFPPCRSSTSFSSACQECFVRIEQQPNSQKCSNYKLSQDTRVS